MNPLTPTRTLVLAGLAALATCAPAPNASSSDAREASDAAVPAHAPAAARSLHLLPAVWTDQHGRERTLADLGGRVSVVAMVYTHCSFACPALVARMKAIGERVERDPRVGFVLVSIDPERDTPERLADFARSARLDPERWTLLRGDQDDVLTLSVLLGVKVQASGDGAFAHSNVLSVLDPSGVVVHRVEGLGADLEPVVKAVQESAAQWSGATAF